MLSYSLSLEKCEFYLYRGACYFEKAFGQYYDLSVTFNFRCKYGEFLNYRNLYFFVRKLVNSLRFEYLEELCYLVSVALLRKYPTLVSVDTRLLKPLILIGGRLKTVWVRARFCR